MIIACASGKGGTGKTTLATALALSVGGGVTLADCDVEEPNAHFFLKPDMHKRVPVTIQVPKVNEETCTACGECAAFCEFNALAVVGGNALVFAELCHACGGCAKVCPTSAITEVPRKIGEVALGDSGPVRFVEGRLEVGVSSAVPVIRATRKQAERSGGTVILDCPPGTSCAMVTAVHGADFVILVTEPTPFGLHDLDLAVKTVQELALPFGVVINRSDAGDDRVVRYCEREGIDVLLEIPEDRRIAEAYSRGEPILNAAPDLAGQLRTMLEQVTRRVGEAGA